MSSPSVARVSPRTRKTTTQSPAHTPLRFRDSPRRTASPRTPAQFDLEKALSQIQLHDEELLKVRNLDRKHYADELAARDAAIARTQKAELDAAARFRESIRLEAENVLQQHIAREVEEAHRRAEAERQKQLETERANAERDRKLKEEKERLARAEQERKEREVREKQERAVAARKAEEERAQDEAARVQKEADDKARQDAEDEVRRQQAENAAKVKQQEVVKQAQSRAVVSSDSASQSDTEQIHREYLVLYQRLKKYKNDFVEEIKALPQPEKAPVGDGRRLIKANIGKLSYGETRANNVTTEQIKQCLSAALNNTTRCGRPIPINELLPASMNLNDNNQQTMPLIAVYFLALLAQQVCKIFTSYVHGEPQRAEPIGICMTSIFGWDKLQFQRRDASGNISRVGLISILMAKYHKMCPSLFGITGDQNTTAGKRKLGWQLIHDPNAVPKQSSVATTTSYENRGKRAAPTVTEVDETPKTMFVLENTHYDRMKGLAIGYSAVALRNASASKTLVNPYPPVHFWLSLAQIINLSPQEIQPTHMCILRYMFGHNGIQRFLTFFGAVGVAVLREAFVELPRRIPEPVQSDSFTREVIVMVEKELAGKMKFHLT